MEGKRDPPSVSSQATTAPNSESIPRKNTERMITMMNTKIAVRTVSCRVGQTTLLVSARTWFTNSAGDVFLVFSAIRDALICDRNCLPSGMGAAPPRFKSGGA